MWSLVQAIFSDHLWQYLYIVVRTAVLHISHHIVISIIPGQLPISSAGVNPVSSELLPCISLCAQFIWNVSGFRIRKYIDKIIFVWFTGTIIVILVWVYLAKYACGFVVPWFCFGHIINAYWISAIYLTIYFRVGYSSTELFGFDR